MRFSGALLVLVASTAAASSWERQLETRQWQLAPEPEDLDISVGNSKDLHWLTDGLPPRAVQLVRTAVAELPEPAVERLRRPPGALLKVDPQAQPLIVQKLHGMLAPVMVGFALILLLLASFGSCSHEKQEASVSSTPAATVLQKPLETQLHTWSTLSIMALTSYRFYTGFLSATWMPYLLAMEGKSLADERQAFFMGSAKLIYGLSILLNPIFGLAGDQMAVVSHWSGRRLFILFGVGASGLGIYGCLIAAQMQSVGWYMAATILWMLGEAMADVTTETLVPELLPRSQYEVSSAIRALNFLLGGIAGYAALIFFRHWHYSWLYYGYLVVMFLCAFLSLCFINTDDLTPGRSSGRHSSEVGEISVLKLITQAYWAPMQYEGGFGRACLALFTFSLGTAPMFMTLLLLRDVIGIHEPVLLQTHFSFVSITFFISAALASTMGAVASGRSSSRATGSGNEAASGDAVAGPEAGAGICAPRHSAEAQENIDNQSRSWFLMILSTVSYGAATLLIPLVGFLGSKSSRASCFYGIGILLGSAFGSVYTRFQERTWSILPQGVDVANAMGFAAMCKLAGVGIGNFMAGLILDFNTTEDRGYEFSGYVIMCLFCAIVVFISAGVAYSVSRTAMDAYFAHMVE
mmetsp:Transcript_104128/g.222475  ORF Transcript_104128/g.222475 Transcript_104128/m.222475 type:complete len:636 (+) Transcript_104128:146-2053(+)